MIMNLLLSKALWHHDDWDVRTLNSLLGRRTLNSLLGRRTLNSLLGRRTLGSLATATDLTSRLFGLLYKTSLGRTSATGRSLSGRSLLGRSLLVRTVTANGTAFELLTINITAKDLADRSLLGRSLGGRSLLGRSLLGRSLLGRNLRRRSLLTMSATASLGDKTEINTDRLDGRTCLTSRRACLRRDELKRISDHSTSLARLFTRLAGFTTANSASVSH